MLALMRTVASSQRRPSPKAGRSGVPDEAARLPAGLTELSLETMIQTLFISREDLRRSSLAMNKV